MRQQLWCDSRQAERKGLDRICNPGLLGHGGDALVWKAGYFYFVNRKVEKGDVLKWVWRSGVKDVEDSGPHEWVN